MQNEKIEKLESIEREMSRLKEVRSEIVSSIKTELSNNNKTIVFVDMVDSTKFKMEHMRNPEVWILRLYQFCKILTAAITECKGVVVKYIGDEVMSFFDNINDVKNFIGRISEIESNLKLTTGFDTTIKITIDYGPVYMMNFEGHSIPDPQGVTVDRCARIAKLNQKSCVLTSVNFKDKTGDLLWQNLGKIALKGIGEEYIYQLEKNSIVLDEKISISKKEWEDLNEKLEMLKHALEQKDRVAAKKILSADEEDDVQGKIKEIKKLIYDAHVDAYYYARFIFLAISSGVPEKYNSFEGKVFDSLIEKRLVSETDDGYYVLSDHPRNQKILDELGKLDALLKELETEEDLLYERSIRDADFWENEIGFKVIL